MQAVLPDSLMSAAFTITVKKTVLITLIRTSEKLILIFLYLQDNITLKRCSFFRHAMKKAKV